ncbi:hypothetical protein [Salininema proteolyticum]|uniref:Uncharacterized protein n=1 Tax=Salininema proteolyticum TaxID=1607685 RepID=A0ABV8TYX9_9ACTN
MEKNAKTEGSGPVGKTVYVLGTVFGTVILLFLLGCGVGAVDAYLGLCGPVDKALAPAIIPANADRVESKYEECGWERPYWLGYPS